VENKPEEIPASSTDTIASTSKCATVGAKDEAVKVTVTMKELNEEIYTPTLPPSTISAASWPMAAPDVTLPPTKVEDCSSPSILLSASELIIKGPVTQEPSINISDNVKLEPPSLDTDDPSFSELPSLGDSLDIDDLPSLEPLDVKVSSKPIEETSLPEMELNQSNIKLEKTAEAITEILPHAVSSGSTFTEDLNWSTDVAEDSESRNLLVNEEEFDPEYELPEDFNPFDLEFSALGDSPTKVPSDDELKASEVRDMGTSQTLKEVPLVSAINVSNLISSKEGSSSASTSKDETRREDLFGPVSESDGDDDDPSYDSRRGLCCTKCSFASWNKKEFQNHVMSHSTSRVSSRKRSRPEHYNPAEFENKPRTRRRGPKLAKRSICSDGAGGKYNLEPLQTDFKLFAKPVTDNSGTGTTTGDSEFNSAGWRRVQQVDTDVKKEYNICCNRCNFVTADLNLFRVHMEERHMKERRVCPYCHHVYTSEQDYQQHKEVHANTKKLYCPVCPFTTVNQRYFKLHKSAHKLHRKGGDKISLKRRPAVATTASDMSVPRLTKLKCPTCNYMTLSSVSYKAHLKTHSKVVKRDCLHCSFSTEDEQEYQSHMDTHAQVPDTIEFISV